MLRASVVVLVLVASATRAGAYEFWLRSQTIGQAYQLRDYRLVGPDLFLGRRRYTETLALRIWDVGDLAQHRRESRLPERGLRISWQSYLRVDHDFGGYASGKIATGGLRRDALDVIPELDESTASLELLYGYLELAGIADDRVTVRVGRLPFDDGWGSSAIDGASARVELPRIAHDKVAVAVSASAGLRVRASSPLGLSAYELDGTAGAACREYVEAVTPGTGHWKLIDRSREIENSRLSSDFEYCPQRDVLQPSIGAAIGLARHADARSGGYGVEFGYRRTWSSTVGLIGPVDRLDVPDQGLYPNEFGQAPDRGVNEEHVHARLYAELARGVTVFSNLRTSLLHAAIDRADAGVRLSHGAHSLEPSVAYFLPTFDGDSIFNVFSIDTTTDARLAYRYDGALRVAASAWLRRYATDAAYAGGAEGGVERTLSREWRVRADALWDDGYGGRRAGGGAEAGWHPNARVWLRGRALALAVAPDDDRTRYVTGTAVASSTWRLGDAAALHAIVEADQDAIHDTQLRAIAVLDLAFAPEP